MTLRHLIHTPKLRSQKGMTLVELAVVSLLIAIMGSILYGTLNGILKASQAIEIQRDSIRTTRYVFLRMIREINGTVSTDSIVASDPDNKNAESAAKLIGINRQNDDADTDQLTFITTSGSQVVYGGLSNYGSIQVTYHLEQDNEHRFSDTTSDIPTYVLVRDEQPAGIKNKDVIKQRKLVIPIATNIASLNFRYLLNKKWKDQWNDKSGALPEAVEITVKVAAGKERVDTYRTAVALPKQPK